MYKKLINIFIYPYVMYKTYWIMKEEIKFINDKNYSPAYYHDPKWSKLAWPVHRKVKAECEKIIQELKNEIENMEIKQKEEMLKRLDNIYFSISWPGKLQAHF